MKNRTDALVVPDAKVYNDTKKAGKKFKDYERQADGDARVVKNATKMANDSKTTAKSVMEIITQVRTQIRELGSQLSDIVLDYEMLEELEKKIEEQEAKDRALETSVKVIYEKKVEIDKSIQGYYIDIKELEEALIELDKNHKKLPRKCLKDRVIPN